MTVGKTKESHLGKCVHSKVALPMLLFPLRETVCQASAAALGCHACGHMTQAIRSSSNGSLKALGYFSGASELNLHLLILIIFGKRIVRMTSADPHVELSQLYIFIRHCGHFLIFLKR